MIIVYSLLGYQLYPYLDIIHFTLASGCLVVSSTVYREKDEIVTSIDNYSVIDSLEDGVILLDRKDKVLYMNRTFKNYFSDHLIRTKGKDIDLIFPNLGTKIKALDSITKSYKEPKTFFLDGKTYELNISGLFNHIKRHVGKTVIIRDITEKKATENIIRENEEKYRMIFEKSSDGIFRYNLRENSIEANPALAKMLGYENGKRVDNKYIKEVIDVFREDIIDDSGGNILLQKQLDRINGSKIWVEVSLNKDLRINGDAICNGIIRDITYKKSYEDKIKYLSFHDKLTGLYNRAFFEAEIKRLDKTRQLPLTVVISDMDGLKVINDAFGHETGDKMIKKVANIFRICFRSEDIISRYGGDEFAILLPSTTTEEALKIINRVKETCMKESNRVVPLSISMGVATKDKASQDINTIIKDADDLMYKNKLVNKKSPQSSLISSLEKALEERNYETVEHVRRIREGVILLGKELDMEESNINDLKLLSTLHDIGKIGISDNIILKESELNTMERKAVEKHSEIGYRIANTSNELSKVAKSILHHHEWWNGEGYPYRLKGKKIPINSRIVSIVDAYDAMTNDRPYRKAWKKDRAISELIRCSDSQFDPMLTKSFINIYC
jgi:diguanylate cyclase (GGDEF)-like protein/PAS domain S-box-containing protein